MIQFRAWTIPLIVAAIVMPIVAGFAAGGPALGVAMGFAAGALLAFIAVRQKPGGTIETVASNDGERHVLMVLSHELDDPATIERVKREAGLETAGASTRVQVLVPARSKLLDRWATDVEPARLEAQRKLVVSIASLGKADVSAEAVVGDQDIVQAVEDQLRSFPASEVVLVTGTPEADPGGERAASELAERLTQPLARIVLDDLAPGPSGA